MIKIPLNILMSLVTFVISAGILILIFGSPKCDDLANTTAFYLKTSIDEVSKDNFYSWNKNSIPPDDQPSYYRTAAIALCQDKGISYLETILGSTTEPQYKIYFETFPEGGGGTWTEAYPWSGGASSTLRMWAYLRIGTGAFKIGAKYLSNVAVYNFFLKKLFGTGEKVVEEVSEETYIIDDVAKKLADNGEAFSKGGTADWAFEVSKTGEADNIIEKGIADGTIGDEIVDGKIKILKDKKSIMVPVEREIEGVMQTQYKNVYVKWDGDLIDDIKVFDSVVDEADAMANGYQKFEASPADMYRNWLETQPQATKDMLRNVYVIEGEEGLGLVEKIKGRIRETGFYDNFYRPVEDKLKRFATNIDRIGYNIDDVITIKDSTGIKLGLISSFDNPDVADEFLKQDGFREKIASFLGKTPQEIQASHIKDFINNIQISGIDAAFVFKGSDMDAISSAIRIVEDGAAIGIDYNVPGGQINLFRNAFGYDLAAQEIIPELADRYKIIENMAGIIEETEHVTPEIAKQKALDRASSFVDSYIFPHLSETTDRTALWSKVMPDYLPNLVRDANGADDAIAETAGIQLSSVLGYVEQNKDALPKNIVRSRSGTAVQYFKNQGKKMIYLYGPQNIINPTSFYARAFFTNQAAGCEGNSICLYSYGALAEVPLYLNESADKFDIRVWRPVDAWQQWAGWQAALQHIPEHPRFYVVSPCLANAKIWKTTYNKKPTIFVYPEKIDLEGNASNYCYADTTLINEYVAIWLASDAATLIDTVTGFGKVQKFLSLPTAAIKKVSNVLFLTDPVTLAQGIAEGFVSWPGLPFKTLTWEQIASNQGKIGLKGIKTGEEK